MGLESAGGSRLIYERSLQFKDNKLPNHEGVLSSPHI